MANTTTILIASDKLGHGEDELGALLMKNFIYSLARSHDGLERVLFMNSGVTLACEGSASLDDLRILLDDGVAVRSCGTCLDFLGLKESLTVGEVGTMPDAAAALSAGDALVMG